MTESKKEVGKGKYQEWLTEEGLLKLQEWSRDGLTDVQIASNMGVSPSTLYSWKKKYPELLDSLNNGNEVVDQQVENALLKRALGYKYEEITYSSGEEIRRVVKEVRPDITAQIFWLKNRRPDIWLDKKDVEHSGSFNTSVDLSGLTVKELRAIANSNK